MKRITSILVNAILCVYLVVGGSIPVQANSPTSQPQQLSTGTTDIYLPLVMRDYSPPLLPIIPDTTDVLTTTTTDHLASISGDGAVFTFTQSTPELAALAPGDIIVGAVSQNAPNGFLRKVAAVQTVGEQVVVDTSAATLDDALQQGELHVSKALTPDQIQTAEYAPGVSLVSPSLAAQSAIFYLEIKDVVLYDADGNLTTKGDQVLGNGSIEVEPTLNIDLRFENLNGGQPHVTLTAHDKVEIEIESNVILADLKQEQELARYWLKPITVMVGVLPVVMTPVLTFVVGVDGSVHIGVSTQVTQEATLTGGVQYKNDSWGPVSQFTNQFHWQPPTLSAGLDLKGYAGPRLEVLIYGVVGPQFTLSGYVKLEADTAEKPWWKLYGGLELSAGVHMEILSKKIASYDYPAVIGVKLLLAQAPNSSEATSVSAGWAHTCALMQTGGVKCWGDNRYGELGDGTTTERHTPVEVSGLGGSVSAISAGADYTCALMQTGGVKCWGENWYGQLGDGTTTDRFTPVDVSGLGSGVRAISAGGYHTCALMQTGEVKCWGNNLSGQLGDGTTTERHTPVDVSGLVGGASTISAGAEYTCALMQTGGVKCWGDNLYGVLGDGTTIDRYAPVDVSGLGSGVSAIRAGWSHTCALMQTGGAKCWGDNEAGELGDGTTTDRLTPVDVSGLASGVNAISAGSLHTCALMQTGGVKCWGVNDDGELGDTTTTERNTPVEVSGLGGGVSAISAGALHTCALMQTSGVKCWGENWYGQLGDGTTTDRFTPVDVIGLP